MSNGYDVICITIICLTILSWVGVVVWHVRHPRKP